MEAVVMERHDAVVVMTLDRPQSGNAVNSAMAHALAEALEALDADASLRVGVITGAGRGFCAGMDLKAFVAGEDVYVGDRGFAGIAQRSARKPLIAALEGFAVAGGLEIALACDLIVAGRSTKLGIPEVKRSLVASGGALARLPRRVGFGRAMDLALTGELIDGTAAAGFGLVDRLVDDGEALATAIALAARIADNGPLALAATKAVLDGQYSWPPDEFWARQAAIVDPVYASRDAREGSLAFAEKREPNWVGE